MSHSPHLDGGSRAAHEDIEPSSDDSADDHRLSYEDRLVAADTAQRDSKLDRLLEDTDLLLNLQLHNYAPKVWEPVANEFARYGLGVFRSWIGTGLVFGMVTEVTGYGFPYKPDERITNPDDVEDLASLTVVYALEAFLEKVLKANRWDPQRGASLKTFFIGQCKLQFPNVFKEWARQQKRTLPADSLDSLVERNVFAPAHDNVEAAVDRKVALDEVFSAVDNAEARTAFSLKNEGYTHDEIAMITGLKDAKAVENLLGRWKRRLNCERRSA